MKCEEAQKNLALFDYHVPASLSKEKSTWMSVLPAPSERHGIPWAKVEAHLADCVSCRRYLHEIRRLRALLHDVKAPAFSNEYLDDFTARVVGQFMPKRGLWSQLKYWFEQFELAPLTTLTQATAVLGTVCVLALQVPGVEPAVRMLTGL